MSGFVLVAAAIALLLGLVVVLRLHAFLALLLTSLATALAGGLDWTEIVTVMREGMGHTLGAIAIVIGLGAMFGEILYRSGGARVLANRLLNLCGRDRVPLALALIGLLVAIPVFFDVAFVLFVPLLFSLARQGEVPVAALALPLLAGLAVAHAFVPPTPGPVAVAGLVEADLGWVIGVGLAAGIPALAVGALYGRFVGLRLRSGRPEISHAAMNEPAKTDGPVPAFGVVLMLLLLPLVMILMATSTQVLLAEGHPLRPMLAFVGHPFTALTLGTVIAYGILGRIAGFSREALQTMATESLAPVGMIILVTGAGGVLGKVLFATGAAEAIGDNLVRSGIHVVTVAFVIAAGVRVAQGSATVAMVTAAGLIAPLLGTGVHTPAQLAAITIAIAAGATVLSHVNDSGFWLVSRYLGLDLRETLLSWSITTTLIGLTGFAVVRVGVAMM